jgi:hypothetical protein
MTQPNPYWTGLDLRLDGVDIDGLIRQLEGGLDRLQTPATRSTDFTITCYTCINCTCSCASSICPTDFGELW